MFAALETAEQDGGSRFVGKKPYSKPALKHLDPQEVLAGIKAAAQAGDKSAQAMLDRIKYSRKSRPAAPLHARA